MPIWVVSLIVELFKWIFGGGLKDERTAKISRAPRGLADRLRGRIKRVRNLSDSDGLRPGRRTRAASPKTRKR